MESFPVLSRKTVGSTGMRCGWESLDFLYLALSYGVPLHRALPHLSKVWLILRHSLTLGRWSTADAGQALASSSCTWDETLTTAYNSPWLWPFLVLSPLTSSFSWGSLSPFLPRKESFGRQFPYIPLPPVYKHSVDFSFFLLMWLWPYAWGILQTTFFPQSLFCQIIFHTASALPFSITIWLFILWNSFYHLDLSFLTFPTSH